MSGILLNVNIAGSALYNCLDGDGIFSDPEDSPTFFICKDNVPTKERCPYGTKQKATKISSRDGVISSQPKNCNAAIIFGMTKSKCKFT